MAQPPGPLQRLGHIMAGFRPKWALCGGWAVDAWLGHQTREHADVDIIVFHDDQGALFEHLSGWQLIAHDAMVPDDTTEPWDGRELVLPAHIHARDPEGFDLEVLLNERSGTEWALSREPRVALELRRCARKSVWGLPTVAPQVLLFYKATAYFGIEQYEGRRLQDEPDFAALIPQLGASGAAWLREAIGTVQPGHPWLQHLPD